MNAKRRRRTAPVKVEKTISRRQWDLDLYALPKTYPHEFNEICKLRSLQSWIQDNGLEELQLRLGPIVFIQHRRYHDVTYQELVNMGAIEPEPRVVAKAGKGRSADKLATKQKPRRTATKNRQYFVRIKECLNEIRSASRSLDAASKKFQLLDVEHLESISTMSERLLSPKNPLKNVGSLGLLKLLIETKSLLNIAASVIEVGTNTMTDPPSRGRPGYNDVEPATQLILLWEELTGKRIQTPKGKSSALGKGGAQSVQESIEFVRLGLKMIDPETTLSQAKTAVNNVLSLRELIAHPPRDMAQQMEAIVAAFE